MAASRSPSLTDESPPNGEESRKKHDSPSAAPHGGSIADSRRGSTGHAWCPRGSDLLEVASHPEPRPRANWGLTPIPRSEGACHASDMSDVVYKRKPAQVDRRARRAGGRASALKERKRRRWRLIASIVAVELAYVAGLVVAVPIGPAAVAITITLAFLLAVSVRACLDRDQPARRESGGLAIRQRPAVGRLPTAIRHRRSAPSQAPATPVYIKQGNALVSCAVNS